MNHVTLDQSTIKILYKEYKPYVVPLVVILTCIMLFWMVLIPQCKNVLSIRQQISNETKKLETLKDNLRLLSQADTSEINTYFDTVSQALPPSKDFIAVLNSISVAASNTGVSIGDYGFQVGDLSKLTVSPQEQLSFQLSLTVTGSLENVKNFITGLGKQFPLANITTLTSVGETYDLAVSFYYRPLPKTNFRFDDPLLLPTTKDKAFLDTVSSWQTDAFVAPVSTTAADPDLSF